MKSLTHRTQKLNPSLTKPWSLESISGLRHIMPELLQIEELNFLTSRSPFQYRIGFQEFKAWMEDLMKKKWHGGLLRRGMEPTGHYWFNLGHSRRTAGSSRFM